MSSVDNHLTIPGVEGESTHKDHKGEITLQSWSWGVSNMGNGRGGGFGKGKAQPSHFSFSKTYDKSSPVLAKYCSNGKHVEQVTLTCRKSGEGQKPFLVMAFKEVFITSVNHSGGSGGDVLENVTFSYAQLDVGYKAQDERGGLAGEVKYGWNNKTTVVT